MDPGELDRSVGRHVFGADPDARDAVDEAMSPLYAELPRRIYDRKDLPALNEPMAVRENDLKTAGFAATRSRYCRKAPHR
jgi:hypothetical protein